MSANPLNVPLAANALTTLDDVKVMLGIDLESEDPMRDARLTQLINYVSAWIETMTGRSLRRQVYTQRYQGSSTQELVLMQWPIVRVFYVKDMKTGDKLPASSYDFSLSGNIGVLLKDDGWVELGPRAGLAYDLLHSSRYLEVKYAAGYVLPKDANPPCDPCTLPADLLGVVWQVIQQEWTIQQSGVAGLSAFSISDVSWTFDKEPKQNWLTTIGSYARI